MQSTKKTNKEIEKEADHSAVQRQDLAAQKQGYSLAPDYTSQTSSYRHPQAQSQGYPAATVAPASQGSHAAQPMIAPQSQAFSQPQQAYTSAQPSHTQQLPSPHGQTQQQGYMAQSSLGYSRFQQGIHPDSSLASPETPKRAGFMQDQQQSMYAPPMQSAPSTQQQVNTYAMKRDNYQAQSAPNANLGMQYQSAGNLSAVPSSYFGYGVPAQGHQSTTMTYAAQPAVSASAGSRSGMVTPLMYGSGTNTPVDSSYASTSGAIPRQNWSSAGSQQYVLFPPPSAANTHQAPVAMAQMQTQANLNAPEGQQRQANDRMLYMHSMNTVQSRAPSHPASRQGTVMVPIATVGTGSSMLQTSLSMPNPSAARTSSTSGTYRMASPQLSPSARPGQQVQAAPQPAWAQTMTMYGATTVDTMHSMRGMQMAGGMTPTGQGAPARQTQYHQPMHHHTALRQQTYQPPPTHSMPVPRLRQVQQQQQTPSQPWQQMHDMPQPSTAGAWMPRMQHSGAQPVQYQQPQYARQQAQPQSFQHQPNYPAPTQRQQPPQGYPGDFPSHYSSGSFPATPSHQQQAPPRAQYDPEEAEARVRTLIADTERMLAGLMTHDGRV